MNFIELDKWTIRSSKIDKIFRGKNELAYDKVEYTIQFLDLAGNSIAKAIFNSEINRDHKYKEILTGLNYIAPEFREVE